MNIVTIKIETTGLDWNKDSIIKFTAMKMDFKSNKLVDSMTTFIEPIGDYKIELGAYFRHKIKPDMLVGKPTFKDVAPQIINFIRDCAIVTYCGIQFVIPFLKHELNKVGYDYDFTKVPCYDIFAEENRMYGMTLKDIYKRYTGCSIEDRIKDDDYKDAKAIYSIFYKQSKDHTVMPETIFGEDNVIAMMEFQDKMQPCFTIGKYKKISVEFIAKLDRGYIEWTQTDKCNFAKSTKNYLKRFLN